MLSSGTVKSVLSSGTVKSVLSSGTVKSVDHAVFRYCKECRPCRLQVL